ncbi:hypothetical protein VNPA120661_57470 [Pseudomonas aeruginosa]|nr:hypothetical protein VNPA120661_57470 [Pseudomonas aeruginosa]
MRVRLVRRFGAGQIDRGLVGAAEAEGAAAGTVASTLVLALLAHALVDCHFAPALFEGGSNPQALA